MDKGEGMPCAINPPSNYEPVLLCVYGQLYADRQGSFRWAQCQMMFKLWFKELCYMTCLSCANRTVAVA